MTKHYSMIDVFNIENFDVGCTTDSIGTKCYFIKKEDGLYLHREDGPAVEFTSGINRWYYQGKQIPVSNQQDFESWLRNKAFW
jgi:hypothetical protein